MPIDIVVHDQTVGEPDPVRLHRMASNVGIVSNVRIVKVGNLLLLRLDKLEQRVRAVDPGWISARRRHRGRSDVVEQSRPRSWRGEVGDVIGRKARNCGGVIKCQTHNGNLGV